MAEIADDLVLAWDAVAGALKYHYQILDDVSAIVRDQYTDKAEIIYTYAQAVADGGTWPSITIQIKAVDGDGNESPSWVSVVKSTPFIVIQVAPSEDLATHEARQDNPHAVTLSQLGAGDSATKDIGTTAGTAAAGDHTHPPAAHAHTVSDITDAGTMAAKDVGVTGSFTTVDSKTVTVVDGVITAIV